MLDLFMSAPAQQVRTPGLIALGQGVDSAALLIGCVLLGIVATLAVVGVSASRNKARRAAQAARDNSETMGDLLRTVRMAESMAGLGVWQYEPASGRQHWSPGMRALFGIMHEDAFVAGDAETLLLANGVDLVGSVLFHREETQPFAFHIESHDCEGHTRAFLVKACNLHNASGGVVRVIAVVRDVTDQVLRERELQTSRALALNEANEARALASTDPLTGLANRRKVMAELDRILLRARDSQGRLALIVFDLDHFKTINDTFGHVLGDAVLRRVADIAQGQARGSDVVGRVGGEEFVWIVPRADEEAAQALAERLRAAIALHSGSDDLPCVTASVGCAEMVAGDTALSLFARADAALYEAKNSGRNQVRLAA